MRICVLEVELVTRDDVKFAMKKINRKKWIGSDDNAAEVWKCLGDRGIDFLKNIFNQIIVYETIPDVWISSILVSIYKEAI